jgi:hypothetical protein
VSNVPFDDSGDPFDDPLWKQAELMTDAPPRRAKDYITCSAAWLSKVRPLVRSVDQLVILMLLYRKCLMQGNQTVAFSNTELEAFGISRYTKYRVFTWLQNAGAATIENENGRAPRVTLHWFP